MDQIEQLKPILGDKKIFIFVGIGAFCAGILIGFKLSGGEKVQLSENPVQLISEPQSEPEPQETEAEND